MVEKIMSPAQMRRRARNRKVCVIYDTTRDRYVGATVCYQAIATQCELTVTTVIKILKENNRI